MPKEHPISYSRVKLCKIERNKSNLYVRFQEVKLSIETMMQQWDSFKIIYDAEHSKKYFRYQISNIII